MTRVARPRLDPICAAAVEPARAAAVEEAGAELVGDHVGAEADDDRVVTHEFECRNTAYRGWRWSVTLTRVPRYRKVTVAEVVLLPGPDALLPPAWVPWRERLRPGDLGVGDLMPTAADDGRLVPAVLAGADPEQLEVAFELGLGRARVLSFLGRTEAVERWHAGDAGPRSPIALAAPASCATCGFYLPLAGALRAAFGACGNEYAPDDGRVVSVDHGCGAHSEGALLPGTVPAAAFGSPSSS